MKKQFAALLAALSLLPTLALAQEYYTLPEIREQAKDGWHETYTDKYGRETVVDIDVEVYGEETAPVLKVGWGKYGKFTDDNAFKFTFMFFTHSYIYVDLPPRFFASMSL